MQAQVIVKSVILNHRLKKALLIRRCSEDGVGGGAWESAGGKAEEGETLEEAVVREIHEETGLSIVLERLLYASLDDIGGKKHIFIVYLCTTSEEMAVLSEEHSDYRWVDKEECKKLIKGGIAEDFIRHEVYDIEW